MTVSTRQSSFLAAAGIGAMVLVGCSELPDTPGQPTPPGPGPSDGVLSIEIQGPESIAPRKSAQYTAIERLADGTTRALQSAAWSSSDPSLVQVTSSGLATAQSRSGEIVLSVNTTRRASKEVLVLSPNTFRLIGSVSDMQSTLIANARVEVPGMVYATSDARGAFRLYGVPPEADIRVTADGYATVEQHIQLTTHTSLDFRVDIVRLVNLSGNYTLTLEAGPSCRVPLAVELQRRSYGAKVTQSGARLEVVLTDPGLVMANDAFGRFGGTVTSTGVTFQIFGGWTSGSDLIERLADGSMLEIYGIARTTESSGVLSGPLSGWFDHYRDWVGPTLGACDASGFTLSRR
jgi:hypothetical protein